MKIIISIVSFILILFIIKKTINIINSKIVPQRDNEASIKNYNTTNDPAFKMSDVLSDVLSEDDLKNISSQLDNLSKKLNKKEN